MEARIFVKSCSTISKISVLIFTVLLIFTGCTSQHTSSQNTWASISNSKAQVSIPPEENKNDPNIKGIYPSSEDASKQGLSQKISLFKPNNGTIIQKTTFVNPSLISPRYIFRICSNFVDKDIFQESNADFLPNSKNIKVTFDSDSIFSMYCSKNGIRDAKKRTDVYTDIPTEKQILKCFYLTFKSVYKNSRICFFVDSGPIIFEPSNIKTGFLFD